MIELWRAETDIERFTRVGEHDYQYRVGQMDLFLDELDDVIGQLDDEILK